MSPVVPPGPLPDQAPPPAGPPRPLTAKILVADDDRRNLYAVEEMLRAPGLEVVLVESGEEVLRRVLNDDFAVILLDVRMPRIDGYEIAAMIRARPKSSRIPIIFLTAYNKDELHVFRGYSAGAVDYVFKPIEPLILRSKVEVFVDLYRKTEEIRRQADEERRLLLENLHVRSQKLQAEQALRQREEHQSLVLRALPIALYTAPIREDHRELRFTSDSVERITGFMPQAFLEEADFWESRIHPQDRDRVVSELGKLQDQGGVAVEYRWRCADGSDRYILDQAVLIRNEDGAPREIFGMWFDITERKQLETSLLHASKLEAIGRLTGGIAHDFNNMLSVVIGNLDLLQNSLEGNDKAKRRVKLAIEGAQRCADLTNRLLTFSRRQPLQPSIVNLREMAPGMLDLLQRTLGERIDVQFEIAEDLWPVEVDTGQLETALLNLAVNARDAMPDGGSLTISVANQAGAGGDQAQDAVCISVVDTGVGMPPEIKEKVFEPFFTTKESGKGTGLGLSMVYGFVQQSNGRIEIDSAPERGTTIRIFLPRAKREARPVAGRDGAKTPVHGRGEVILVVEDDAKVRQVTVSTLRSLGFSVREAQNGDEALERLKSDSDIDLVLSDVKMPGSLNGPQLARCIRDHWPDVRVLLTSGYVESGDEIEDFSIIFKPYRASELAEKLRELLDNHVPVSDYEVRAVEIA